MIDKDKKAKTAHKSPPKPAKFHTFLLNMGYCQGALSCDDVQRYLLAHGVCERTIEELEYGFKTIACVLREQEL